MLTEVKISPYPHLFQQRLDPDSLLRQNSGTIILIRFEDCLPSESGGWVAIKSG